MVMMVINVVRIIRMIMIIISMKKKKITIIWQNKYKGVNSNI